MAAGSASILIPLESVRAGFVVSFSCFKEVEIFNYERWLDEVQAYEIKGTHSFAVARLALLAKYGEPRPPLLSERDDAAIVELTKTGGEFGEVD